MRRWNAILIWRKLLHEDKASMRVQGSVNLMKENIAGCTRVTEHRHVKPRWQIILDEISNKVGDALIKSVRGGNLPAGFADIFNINN